jgi:hypothetical protein
MYLGGKKMRYEFYRCVTPGCGKLVIDTMIEKRGMCVFCGGRKIKIANYRGRNMPMPREFIKMLFQKIYYRFARKT